jgi:hypothetical protein
MPIVFLFRIMSRHQLLLPDIPADREQVVIAHDIKTLPPLPLLIGKESEIQANFMNYDENE